MSTNSLKGLRVAVVTLLVFLVFQYELGMAVNLLNPPDLPSFSFSFLNIMGALKQVGSVAVVHAVLGTVLTILALVTLVSAWASKIKSVQVLGVLGFLSMALAATSGLLFVLSGYQNDHYSHGMATNFILTFVFYFLELYFLKPAPKTEQTRVMR